MTAPIARNTCRMRPEAERRDGRGDQARGRTILRAAAYRLISDVSFPTIETLKATAASSGREALAHAAKISSGGAPTIVVVTDDA